MKRTFISIAAAMTLLASQVSVAGDTSEYLHEQATDRSVAVAGKTRAEVKAELKEAVAKGLITNGDRDPAPALSSPSALNRADVQREAIEAKKTRGFFSQDRG